MPEADPQQLSGKGKLHDCDSYFQYITENLFFLHKVKINFCVCKDKIPIRKIPFPFIDDRRWIDMAKNTRQTSKAVASKASKILRDRRYSSNAKSVAGSALAQTKPGRK